MTVGTLRKTAVGAPRVSIGPDVLQMAIGSEGTLGIVTDVVVRLRPQPQVQVSLKETPRVLGHPTDRFWMQSMSAIVSNMQRSENDNISRQHSCV